MDKASQCLTRHWRQPPYHSTHGVMTLGHDGDAGSSVHFGDAIPWKCCLRPPRYYVSQIFAQAKVIPFVPSGQALLVSEMLDPAAGQVDRVDSPWPNSMPAAV